MLDFIKKHKIEVSIFVLAVVLRLIFFLICLDYNNGNIQDTVHGQDGYFEISKNLLEGKGFSASASAPFAPYSYGVPFYPYFLFVLLWLTGGSYLAVGMIQLLLGAALPLLAMYLCKMILPNSNKVSITVGILLAISPLQILYSFIFYTETVFTFIFALFLIAYLKFLRTPTVTLALMSGILLGLSTLTKATVQYIPFIAIVFVLYHFRSRIKKELLIKLGLMLVLFFLVLSPWLYRNYRQFNAAVLSTQMPFNIYGVLLPSVLAIDNNSSFKIEQEKLQINGGELMSNTAKTKGLADEAIKEIMSRPASFMKLSTLNMLTFFTHDGMLTFLQAAGIRPEMYLSKPATVLLLESPLAFAGILVEYMKTSMSFVLLARVFWVLIFAFFLYGIYKLYRSKKLTTELSFVIIIVFYFALTTLINGLAVNARFRMPIEPIYLSVAATGVMYLYQRIRIKKII